MWALLLKQLLLPALLGLFERILVNIFGFLKSRDEAARNVALGQQQTRADRLAAEARLNKEMQDEEDRARTALDADLRERLRDTLGRGRFPGPGGGLPG